jgi:hypothetical protein
MRGWASERPTVMLSSDKITVFGYIIPIQTRHQQKNAAVPDINLYCA